MAKLPTKGKGVNAAKNGYPIHCVETGEFKGVMNYAWKHADESPVFRKINGTIEFVEPSGNESSPVSEAKSKPLFGTVDDKTDVEITLCVNESRFTALAADIARARYPGMSETSQTFGMIVNAIKGSLITLQK